MMIRLVKDLP